MIPEDVKTELAPCPFCGGEAEQPTPDAPHGGMVQCSSCGASAFGPKWNRRAILTDREARSGWHSHDGMSDPDYPVDGLVQVCFRDGSFAYGLVHDWDQNWQWVEGGKNSPGAIIAWRPHPAHSEAQQPEAYPVIPAGYKLVPVEPTPEMIRAMSESKAVDDEGEFPPMYDLLDFSGENKRWTVLKAAYAAVIAAAPSKAKEAVTYSQEEYDEAYEIGKRDGYSDAVQDIDEKTGGDGEYRYCLGMEDDIRHQPDPETMTQRIVDRFETLNLLEDASKSGRDQEWGDKLDTSALLLEAEKALEPFAALTDNANGKSRYFIQLLVCPEGDTPAEGVKDYGGAIRAARSTLSKIRGGE